LELSVEKGLSEDNQTGKVLIQELLFAYGFQNFIYLAVCKINLIPVNNRDSIIMVW
jgi:hypothetical protein